MKSNDLTQVGIELILEELLYVGYDGRDYIGAPKFPYAKSTDPGLSLPSYL